MFTPSLCDPALTCMRKRGVGPVRNAWISDAGGVKRLSREGSPRTGTGPLPPTVDRHDLIALALHTREGGESHH